MVLRKMGTFNSCIEYIVKYEGGYNLVENVKDDAGGLTRAGITIGSFLESKDLQFDNNKNGKLDKNDLLSLTKEQINSHYKKEYWDKFKLDDKEISTKKAFCILDCAINNGIGGCSKITQRALNACGFNLTVDGKFGALSRSALIKCPEDKFIRAFIDQRTNYYKQIVNNKPSQKKFLKGWLNRLSWLQDDLKKITN